MDAERMEPEGYLTTTVPPIKQTNKQTRKDGGWSLKTNTWKTRIQIF